MYKILVQLFTKECVRVYEFFRKLEAKYVLCFGVHLLKYVTVSSINKMLKHL